MRDEHKLIMITGLIVPADWDQLGNVTEIKICTPGEVDYLILKNNKASRLFAEQMNFVSLEGFVHNHGSYRTIEVKHIVTKGFSNDFDENDPKRNTGN